MSAHPAPRARRAISAETAGSSSLALGPNQRGKAGGEVEASIPVMAMAHQGTRGKVPRRTWPNLAATPLDQGDAGATGRVSRFSLGPVPLRPAGALQGRPEVVAGVDVAAIALRMVPLRDPAGRERGGDDPAAALACAYVAVERFEVPPAVCC